MIRDNIKRIQAELPEGVQLVGAAKPRLSDEVLEKMGVKSAGSVAGYEVVRPPLGIWNMENI